MAEERKSESPSSSEDSSAQKQDPLERRRLQNRLSQRNHRRKIRDRIAKLQERVVANELRAAAALNGWDQPYTSSQPTSTHHSHFTPYKEPDLSFGSPDHSPLSTEPSTPFFPSYPFSSHAISSADMNISYSGDAFYFLDSATCSPSTYSTPRSNHGVPLIVGNNPDLEPLQDPWALGSGVVGNTALPETELPGCTNQNIFYVTTENALPHIIQALKTAPSTSKIIVVLPPTSIPSLPTGPTGCNGPQSSHPPIPTHTMGCRGIENPPQTASGMFNIPCQCQIHSPHSCSKINTVSQTSRCWENANPRSGPYMIGCPIHQKQSISPSESLANMCI